MAIRNIFKEGDPVLRVKCREVERFDERLATLIDDMFDTMHRANGAGLAAPQVGIRKRVAVVDADGTKLEMVNPVILEKDGVQIGPEGCLSVSDEKSCDVKRFKTVKLRAFDRKGNMYEMTVSDFAARAVQHEIDHLDGILFIDYGNKQ